MSIDWVAKLTSRKFWLAICGLASGLMLAFRADESTVNDVTGVIMALGSVIAYIIGEGLTDAAAAMGGSGDTNFYLPAENAEEKGADEE